MQMITLVAMLFVVSVLASTLVSKRPTPQLRPVRVKVRRDEDHR